LEFAGLVEHRTHIGHHVHLGRILSPRQPQRFEFLQTLETLANGTVIRESAAEPALVHVRHAAAGGFSLDGFLGLAFGADKEHEGTLAGELREITIASQEAAYRFTQIDDVDEITFAVNIRAHLRVPPAGTVPKVNTGVDKVLDLDNGHALPSCPQAG